MKEAIQKAIEGGWDKKRALFNPNDASYSMEKMYCDPLFWVALGKSLGWRTGLEADEWGGVVSGEWQYRWHAFIDHLAEGKSAEDFFKELIK